MSRRRRRKGYLEGVDGGVVAAALSQRAEELALQNSHKMTQWQAAKWRYGKGARRAWCKTCLDEVLVLPYGPPRASVGERIPTLAGEALDRACGIDI